MEERWPCMSESALSMPENSFPVSVTHTLWETLIMCVSNSVCGGVCVCVSARACMSSPASRDSEQWSCDVQDRGWLSLSYPVIRAGNHGVRHPGTKPRA